MARHDVGDSPRRPRKCADIGEQDASGRDVDQVRITLRLWQPRTSKNLSQEDAREMAENLIGFFRVLAEWDAKERSSVSTAYEEVTPAPASNEADGNR